MSQWVFVVALKNYFDRGKSEKRFGGREEARQISEKEVVHDFMRNIRVLRQHIGFWLDPLAGSCKRAVSSMQVHLPIVN